MERTTPDSDNTFEIPVERVPDLEHQIAKLNKRAEKLGVAPITIMKGEITETKVHDELSGIDTYEARQTIIVNGDSPKLNGWQFVATLEHDENGTIIRRLPGSDEGFDLTAYRTATPDHCDHCGYKRRRNDTYIVGTYAHGKVSTKQVGSNCLKDFTGHQSPQQIARYLEAVADLIDDVRGGGYSESSAPQRFDNLTFLAHTACMIRHHGWVSRAAARNGYDLTATADMASNNIYAAQHRLTDKQGQPLWIDPSGDDKFLAAQTAIWVKTLLTEKDLENEYMYNLYTSLKGDSIPARQFGIAASAINAYERFQEREIRKRAEAAVRKDEHLGVEREKITFEATITRVTWVESVYSETGTIPLYIFLTTSGHTVKWFSSRDLGFEQGDRVKVTGCVKEHETHPDFGKSTIVTRCKMEKI